MDVIIGTSPYSTRQKIKNDNDKNAEHPELFKRIKDTYIKDRKAARGYLYDSYKQPFTGLTTRWSKIAS